jgi:transcriptional regulator with XRE-family HTH domain
MDANGQGTLGRRLRLRRAELGLTLEELADRTGPG